jgi:hypothetical protein
LIADILGVGHILVDFGDSPGRSSHHVVTRIDHRGVGNGGLSSVVIFETKSVAASSNAVKRNQTNAALLPKVVDGDKCEVAGERVVSTVPRVTSPPSVAVECRFGCVVNGTS